MSTQRATGCFPAPESQGGWRWLQGPEEIRSLAGMDTAEKEIPRCGERW